ncbi:sugar phosphate isomerase/epimerase [Salinisphaera sp. Q1T1-3]|uniref:sugar phosphate isomerase/epimerase family protein n=1 Tax=Salinisphaera sp. Q1T1-3 TaxID=2321229 RepID=UPI000E76F82D|nr:sugar phosphate isomerase/epimerase [Salinisphaera sp. Q1T1-3]RJS92513.1 sugar phosphate isomerase/epimerase [Salinisphaera sp. Q1T1-3]
MRRLGIHSFVWTAGQSQDGLEMALERSAEHGYALVELANLRAADFDLDRLGNKASDLGLGVTMTMGLAPDADVSSGDETVAAHGRAELETAIKAARDVGATSLGGIIYSAHQKYTHMPSPDQWQRSLAAVGQAADIGCECGVSLVLEIVNRFETNLLNTTAQGLKFLDALGDDAVKLHLDTFHMNIEETDPEGAIRMAGDRLGYFHVGENNRGYLGDGVIDFDRIFDALLDIGYDGDVVYESFSSAVVDEKLSRACAIWRDTWTESAPLAAHARQFLALKYDEAQRRRRNLRAAG